MRQETDSYKHLHVIAVIGVTAGILMTAVLFDFPLAAAIMPGFLLLVAAAIKKGYRFPELALFAWAGIKRNEPVVWLLLFIGLILPTWYLSGTIADLNTLFLAFLRPDFFFTAAFLSTMLMSMIVGSAIGSLSIVGLPLIAASETLGLPGALTAGALVSGAFVGDRTSPLSSSFQLLSYTLELDRRKQLKAIFPSVLITVGLTAGAFFIADLVTGSGISAGAAGADNTGSLAGKAGSLAESIGAGAAETAAGAALVGADSAIITASLLISLIPPLLLSLMILLSSSMKAAFSVGISSAVLILLFREVSFVDWLQAGIFGVDTHGGLQGMLPFIVFILVVGAYCQIIENTNMLQPYFAKLFTAESFLTKHTAKTLAAATGVALISPNQSFPILLAGRSLLPFWHSDTDKLHLARILSDSTFVFAGLVPWSLLAILCSTILQVPVISYAPYAVFLWLSPAVTMFYSYVFSLTKSGEMCTKS